MRQVRCGRGGITGDSGNLGSPVLPHESGQQLCRSGSSRPYGSECTARVAKRDLSRETENTAISVKYDFQMLQTIFLTKNQRPPVCNLFFSESLFLMTSHPLLLLLIHFLLLLLLIVGRTSQGMVVVDFSHEQCCVYSKSGWAQGHMGCV